MSRGWGDLLPRRSWHHLCDQVAETVQLKSRQLAGEILGQVEVDLRARQTDVPEVGGQQRQLDAEVRACLVPAQQTQNGERMPNVMQARTLAATEMSDTRELERSTEGPVERVAGYWLLALRTREKGAGRAGRRDGPRDSLPIGPQPLHQIGSEGYGA